jgi:hypothetical protein
MEILKGYNRQEGNRHNDNQPVMEILLIHLYNRPYRLYTVVYRTNALTL